MIKTNRTAFTEINFNNLFMNQETERIFEAIETGDESAKKGALLVLGDDIEYAHFAPEVLQEIVQRLINIAVLETDEVIRGAIFRNIGKGLMQRMNHEEIIFDPLINALDKDEPVFICAVLYLISTAYRREYIPLISKYLDHPDAEVRKEAQESLDFFD